MRHYHPAPTEWREISIVRCPVSTHHFNFILINYQPYFPKDFDELSLMNYYLSTIDSPIPHEISAKLQNFLLFALFRVGRLFELLGYKFKHVNRNA